MQDVAPVRDESTIPFTLPALQENWARIVADTRLESPFLGEALSTVRPLDVSPPNLALEFPEPNPVASEKLTRQRDVVEKILSRRVGAPVRIALTTGTPAPEDPVQPRARRMSDAGAKAERLSTLRKKDAALDAAAAELDLEIVD